MLQQVIQLNPEHFRANLLLGRIFTLQHRSEDALPYLKQAVISDPNNLHTERLQPIANQGDDIGGFCFSLFVRTLCG